MANQADVEIHNEGSMMLFELFTPAAHDWVEENVQTDGYQWLGPHSFAVESRYAPHLAAGMAEAGLEVR